MKTLKSFLKIIFAVAAVVLAMQSCEKSEGYEKGGEAITWRQYNSQSVSAAASTFEFSFVAREAWTATSDNTEMMTIRSAANGVKGRNYMTVAVTKNSTGKERTAHVMITVDGYETEELIEITQEGEAPEVPAQGDSNHPDYMVNRDKIDVYLSERYLWNDEYKTLTRNLGQNYNAFVENTLASMKTNGEDGGVNSNGSRYIYSYILRSPKGSSASRSVLPKESEPTFGVLNVAAVMLTDASGKDTGNRAFCIYGIYPDTPAAKAGIKRGMWITEANGKALTQSNMNDVFYDMLYPSSAGKTMKLKVMDEYSSNAQARDITLTAENLPLNPVLHSEIIENGSSKIGYLVYGSFEASFDDELLAEIRKFKSAGITDLVLDLRANGGGHVISAQMLASVIAGTKSDGKVCLKYEYNKTRMAEKGYSFPDKMESMNFGPDAAPRGQISIYSKSDYLSLSRVYILVTDNTASASELTFTALRGIDFPVTLIGERTEGKNVGMEPDVFTYGNYEYWFYPITFKYYNAKNETCDPSGTKPDYEVAEWSGGYYNWGTDKDPFLAKAKSLIGGSRAVASGTTRAEMNGCRLIPAEESNLKLKPRRGGLIAPLRPTGEEE